MWNAVVVGLCTLAALGGMLRADEPDEPSENEADPFVSINRKNARVCLGTVVAVLGESVQIITAAHCVYGKSNSELTVDLKSDGTTILPIQKVIVHPYYYPPSRDYDIAIIRVKKPTNTVKSLSWTKIKPTDKVFAIEWNAEKPKDVVEGTVEERKSCKAKLSNSITVSTKMVCANIKKVFDGTPLMIEVTAENKTEYKIAGIGSYYVKDNGTLPKVFTSLANSEIYSFIELYIP